MDTMNTLNKSGAARTKDYIQDQITRKEESNYSGYIHESPSSPAAVLFFGEQESQIPKSIKKSLKTLWPANVNDLICMNIFLQENNLVFRNYDEKIGQSSSNHLDLDGFHQYLDQMLSEDTHFSDYKTLRLYFVIDDAACRTFDDFKQALKTICTLKEQINFSANSMEITLFILMNESLSSESKLINSEIKNEVLNLKNHPEESPADNLVLLSNRLSNGQILKDHSKQTRIIADFIAVTNSGKPELTNSLGREKVNVYSIGYSIAEKPVEEISRRILKEILSFISGNTGSNFNSNCPVINSYQQEQLKDLFFTPYGVPQFLHDYLKTELSESLPTDEEIDHYPVSEKLPEGELLSSLSFEEIQERTFHVLDCRIDQIEKLLEKKLSSIIDQEWRKQYLISLNKKYSLDDQKKLKSQRENIETLMQQAIQSEVSSSNLDSDIESRTSARILLDFERKLTRDFNLQQMCLNIIDDVNQRQKDLLNNVKQMEKELSSLSSVENESIIRYYDPIFRSFTDSNQSYLRDSISTIEDYDSLQKQIESIANKYIENQAEFGDSFEQELVHRSGSLEANQREEKYSQINSTLLDGNVLYKTIHTMPVPILQVVFLRKDESRDSLYQYLKNHKKSARFYNAGSGNRAEGIQIYELSDDHLLG